MKVIVGLGNPGLRYRHTRHNVGFEVADYLAARWNAKFSREKYKALVAEAECEGETVVLVKPLVYMNNSGLSVSRVVRYCVRDLAHMLVVVDDVNLPLGKLRIRAGGSAGGHNGLQSVIDQLGTDAFPRLRLGVGADKAAAGLVQHVLGRFDAEERPVVAEMVDRGAAAAIRFIADGVVAAMDEFN